jgi:hypothetical protein
MTRADDRIPVPTNGHKPPPPVDARPPGPDPGPAGPDLRIAVTPAQAAVGFGIIASLILVVLGRRRRRG